MTGSGQVVSTFQQFEVRRQVGGDQRQIPFHDEARDKSRLT
jgi:hypothetical protein